MGLGRNIADPGRIAPLGTAFAISAVERARRPQLGYRALTGRRPSHEVHRDRIVLSALFVAAAVAPAAADDVRNQIEKRQDRREIRQDRREIRDDSRDLERLEQLRHELNAAGNDAKAIAAVDREIGQLLASEAKEGRKEVAQAKREVRRGQP